MDAYNQQRSRSRSTGRSPHNHSPSPQMQYQQQPQYQQDQLSNVGLDPAISQQTFTTGPFNSSGFEGMGQDAYNYNAFQSPPNQTQFIPQGSMPDTTFYGQGPTQDQFQQQPDISSSGFHAGTTLDDFIDPNGGQGQGFTGMEQFNNQNNFNNDYAHQSSYQSQSPSQQPSRDLSHRSSPHNPTPPSNLLSPEDQSPSPSSTAAQYYTPQHSRHASLDPSSAAYPQGQEWQGMLNQTTFQGHRRGASDHSDISSSAAPSPYLGTQEYVDTFENTHSPSLNALTEANDYTNDFGIQNINIAEQNRRSPYHSAHASPQMLPQQPQGLGIGQDFTLASHLGQATGPGPEIFTQHVDNSLQKLHDANGSHTSGRASQFPVPTIDIEPAPVSRQASFEPDKGGNVYDTLSPPSRPRGRSKSDPHVRPASQQASRSNSPGAGHIRSPSLAGQGSLDGHSSRSLSPMAPGPGASSSRDPSPNRIEKNRRSSTSSVPSRDYILDLADPERPNASPNAGQTRVQKHPATFQCNLCPKRFTRAYNLRSHLRTHTDERPFVCTVCGKAFARQHDRKRHEGLHSGEKKFICKGELTTGGSWGCGRRFARADALGRHFRSEAGRVCIKPLLDEEAAEHSRRAAEQQSLDMQAGLQPVQQPMMVPAQSSGATPGFMLPAALLAQYPALNNIDWSTVPQQPDELDPGDLSDIGGGRSSFDASSAAEYDDEEYGNGAANAFGNPLQGQMGYTQPGGW